MAIANDPRRDLAHGAVVKMWQRRRRAQREVIALTADPVPGRTNHFRFDPYVTPAPQGNALIKHIFPRE